MNTIHLNNQPIWAHLTHDPYNHIGIHVFDDSKRTKYITRCRVGNSTAFNKIVPIDPQPTRLYEVIND
jgi:hypothetical protein